MEDLASAATVRSAAPRRSRRLLLGVAAGAAGSALLVAATATLGPVRASDDHDGDNSGSGGDGSGRGRGRGRGGDEPDAEEAAVAITGEVPAGSIEVRIVSDDAGGFVPGELTVDAGQSVTFVNAHDDEHTATGSGFDTGIIQPGSLATVLLDEPGAFAYACQIHPEMIGRIAVRDASGNVPPPAPSAPPAADSTVVRIANLAFDPASLTIPVGSTVAWTNGDAVPHTATALDGSFDSDIFDPGATFSHTFSEPGTFDYRCNLHPQMTGIVVVEGGTPGEAPAATDAAPPAASVENVATPAAPTTMDERGPIGVWFVLLTPDDGAGLAPQRGLLTLHADGTLDAAFAAASADPDGPIVGPAQGEWRAEGDDGYALTAVALLLDADGRFAGTLTLRDAGRLAADADGFRGAFAFELAGADGNRLESGGGTTDGERVGLATPPLPPAGDAGTVPATPAPPASAQAANDAAVSIVDFAFEPARLEVAVGTTVAWTNRGEAPHTATAEDGAFDTGQLDAGAVARVAFEARGTYAYACLFHPEMTGTIVVA